MSYNIKGTVLKYDFEHHWILSTFCHLPKLNSFNQIEFNNSRILMNILKVFNKGYIRMIFDSDSEYCRFWNHLSFPKQLCKGLISGGGARVRIVFSRKTHRALQMKGSREETDAKFLHLECRNTRQAKALCFDITCNEIMKALMLQPRENLITHIMCTIKEN